MRRRRSPSLSRQDPNSKESRDLNMRNELTSALTVRVLSPNGGETVQAGTPLTIQWTSSGATSQRVQYSLDGVDFVPIATGLSLDVQSFSWNVPASLVPQGQARVKAVVRVLVKNGAGQQVLDTSDHPARRSGPLPQRRQPR